MRTPIDITATLAVIVYPSCSVYGQTQGGFAVYLTTEARLDTFHEGDELANHQQAICLHDGVTYFEGQELARHYAKRLGQAKYHCFTATRQHEVYDALWLCRNKET